MERNRMPNSSFGNYELANNYQQQQSNKSPYVGQVHYEPRIQSTVQHRTNMTQRDEVQKFEQGRIRFLQEERLHIQKKTFTKWMNSFLCKVKMEVEDLFVDLADGKKLLKLLEIISGEKLAKPNAGRMRVHKIENVNKSLAFLHTKVRLESIGAEDIVDGKDRLILGLIWTIILRFQIQEIEIDVDEENESSEKKSAKDALLLWAQRKTQGYAGVEIRDFSSSWRNGLGFNALIHSHRPDLFDYNKLPPNKNIDNLNHAFDVANNELGIPSLLDAEDIDTTRPDEKSIMTYIASYYHTFAKMKNEEKSGRRIAKIINQMVESDKKKSQYDSLTTDLLEWIKQKVKELQNHNFPNSLEGIQNLLLSFGHYITQEKPMKYKERSEIEALYFNINTQLKELKQPAFNPADGKLVQDIERAWEVLERAEHTRGVALHSELRRQEYLEQLYYKFEKKSVLREGYVKEMLQVLSDPRYGSNLTQVDATLKKHEAISADIMAREERVHNLKQMCEELVEEKFRLADRVKTREKEILTQWNDLLELLNKHKFNLNRMDNVMALLREIDTTLVSIHQLKVDLSSTDTGVHLIGVEELLHKHALHELQVSSVGESERKLHRMGDQLAAQNPKEKDILEKKLGELSAAYKDLQLVSSNRKSLLEEARNFYQFLQDQEDEEVWLIEKQRICQAGISAKDLRGVLSLQQKHKVLMDEVKARRNKFDQLGATGKQLLAEKHPRSSEIQHHMERNKDEWARLEELLKKRAKELQDAAEAYQFYADANEADSWLNEKTQILTSSDYGSDEPSAQALLQRHKDLEGELNAYSGDIQSLNTQADRLIASGISHLDLNAEPEVTEPVEEVTYETKMIPIEVWEDQPVEKVDYKTVYEERVVPQVKAKYAFSEHGLTMAKGEVMVLLNKSNPDWWCVRKADGTDGFAPANYVHEIDSRIIKIQLRKPETVKTVQRVKKTKMVKQKVPVKVLKQPLRLNKRKIDDSDSVPKRQKKINDTYEDLKDKATKRHALLEDAIRLFKFYKECDDFEKWIKDKEKLLSVDDPNDNVEQAKRKYEKFVTDLSASNKRMDELDAEVLEFEQQKHSQIDKVRARHRQIQALWRKLNQLKAQKEKSLEGASSVELFNKTCDEARDWMNEKMNQLDIDVLGHDLKTVQALQRRHDNLERELDPLEKKINKVMLLANSVKASYPNERDNVAKRQNEVEELWQKVKDKATERRMRLENAVGQQIFTRGAKDLLRWVSDVKSQLNADNTARDVQTAQQLLDNHEQLEQEIKAKDDEFEQLTNLGRKLLKTNPDLTEVAENVERLCAEQAAIARGWKEKKDWLEQCKELQQFNREADNIDAATSANQVFLEFSDLGNSLDEVEALQKQHRAFANTLYAQDDRVNNFSKNADKLINKQHYDSKGIDNKRNQVLQRRQAVKEACQQRTNVLDASKYYQEFCAEVSDLRSWMAEKLKTASDESYRDLSNLERKLQKHEAFERELRANEGQLRTVNKLGQALIAQNNYRKDDVGQTLHDLNDEWQRLFDISLEKGRCLRQAEIQQGYNTSIDDVKNKLDEIDKSLKSGNVGNDLRACKDLLKKHELLENDLRQCGSRVDDLVNQSNDMTDSGHFDSDAITTYALGCKKRLEDLDDPARKRREALEESLKFYNFRFELDNEMQWIKEHLPLASSETFGQNLHQAQNMHKKHKKLEAEINGHQPVIDKSLQLGETLIELKHPERTVIKELCNTLENAWDDLREKANERSQKLELSLKAQQYFFEANEVESWLNEKADILASTDYGRDRDAATKLLTKHKAVELELDTYNNIIAEMGRGAQALVNSGHPDSKLISERQANLEHLVRSLQRKAVLRQHRLMESLFRHEYFLESGELERWIAENTHTASSEDYGQDYEHLLLLKNKFNDFKHRIEAGSERFKQCEDLAQKLISNDSPYISDIEKKQLQLEDEPMSEAVGEVEDKHEIIRNSWEKLHQQINNRENKLDAAGEIHRFHRDVADMLQRIEQKEAALGADLGRDLNSAVGLLRKHDTFENELVVLEASLQVLSEDAAVLKKTYPANKEETQQKLQSVNDKWLILKDKTDLRRDQLQASVDLQKFLAQVRDLTGWAVGLRLAMSAEENVRSAARARALQNEHDALENEIVARQKDFDDVAENLAAMEQTGHYAAPEASKRYKNLMDEYDKLQKAWLFKKEHLEQLANLHVFLRDAKLIEDATNAQEAALSNTDFGETVDEVAHQVKKHEEFEKLMNHQDERLDALIEFGTNLIQQNHFDSPSIKNRIVDVKDKRQQVHKSCAQKKQLLADALLYTEFNRDVGEAQIWIADKKKKLEAEIKVEDVNSLEDKITELKKHTALKAEVVANTERIKEIKSKGNTLLGKRHRASNDIANKVTNLDNAWKQLLYEVDLRGKGLSEAQDILEFNNLLDKIDSFIRDKEVMIQAGDTGKDYEHCQALQRRLDDVDSDMRIDDARIKTINELANKLAKQGHPGVQERRDNFVQKWKNLQGELLKYRNKLAAASEIHLFDHNVADTSERITEKCLAMEVDEVGRNLSSVEALQRKQDAIEPEISAVQIKIDEHANDATLLSEKYPQSSDHLQNQMENVYDQWSNLLKVRDERVKTLSKALSKQKFLTGVKDFEHWVSDTIKRMEAHQNPNNVTEAEALLELHDEISAEIRSRDETFKELRKFGQICSELGDPAIIEGIRTLDELRSIIHEAWEEHHDDLIQIHTLQVFKEHTNQLNNWLASKEAFLNNDDLGDTPRTVEVLIRKHNDFEIMLKQQLTRIDDLERSANKIIAEHPSTTQEIEARLQSILTRKDRLLKSCNKRKNRLQESRDLQKFVRNVYDVEVWLNSKLQIAEDENYRDLNNLQQKIQKHETFQAEIKASVERISKVDEEGRGLIQAKHYASEEIEDKLKELNSDFNQLLDLSNLKSDRLHESYQTLLFIRSIDEFDTWLSEVEPQVKSTDTGKDLASVNNLLKRHTSLENDIQQHNENYEAINDAAEQLIESGNFMAETIQERAESATNRYHQLQEPLQTRRDLLESSTMLHRFTRDVDNELQWLSDREPLVASRDLGSSLTTVQSLQKKHQTLEAELSTRDPIIGNLISRASQLTRSPHTSAGMINEKAQELKTKFAQIRDLASIRKLRLQDALEAQMFYEEAAEAETWIHDKQPLLVTKDVGRDEESAHALLRKLDGLALEIKAFQSTNDKLKEMAKKIVDREHYDAEQITLKQKHIDEQFQELRKLVTEREVRLGEAVQYFSFAQECTDVQDWIKDQVNKADSEEYGNDVEHVELLIQDFDTFFASLMNNEPRVQSCIESGNALIEAGSSYTPEVRQKINDLNQNWETVRELAQARKDALAGAKKVHAFDRKAQDLISWIEEKGSDLSFDTFIHKQNLDSIQELIRKHQGFESEIKAVNDKVSSLEAEGEKLISEYPDTQEHIEDQLEQAAAANEDLKSKAEKQKYNLSQAEELQTYFEEYQDLLAWINEMLAKITAPDLPHEVNEAELLIQRHIEHKVEIESRKKIFSNFYQTGQTFIQQGHFLASEIEDKINMLTRRIELLKIIWDKRNIIYEQNLNVQTFKRNANILENWIVIREGTLKDGKIGDSIGQVEDLLQKHRDFEEAIRSQEEKIKALKQMTLVEEAFKVQQEHEAKARKAEKERLEQDMWKQRKQKEVQRIADLRKQEYNVEVPEQRTNGTTEHNATIIIEPPPINKPPPINTNIRKTNSIAHLFERDRIRRGSDPSVKRAESMKVGAPSKTPKRTPSFTTRRRGSIKSRADGGGDYRLVEADSFLDRKQVTAGNKRAANRKWINSYTVVCGQLLCFFKSKEDFAHSKALCSPIGIYNAKCTVADDYIKKKHTFRLIITDGSEYLFACSSEQEMNDWISKINFRANLPPSQQLLHFEISKDNNELEMSSQSSRTSSPDVGDGVILRQEPNYSNNGISSNSPQRPHTIGETPPPLPMSEPPNNYAGRRYTLENSGSYYDSTYKPPSRQGSMSNSNRSSIQQTGDSKMSDKIRDFFGKKKRSHQM